MAKELNFSANTSPSPGELSYTIQTYSHQKFVEVRSYGTYNITDYILMLTDVQHILTKTKFNKLLYFSSVSDNSNISMEDVKRIIKFYENITPLLKGGKQADVMPNKLAHGMARVWYSLLKDGESFEFEIFESYDKALKWLTD